MKKSIFFAKKILCELVLNLVFSYQNVFYVLLDNQNSKLSIFERPIQISYVKIFQPAMKHEKSGERLTLGHGKKHLSALLLTFNRIKNQVQPQTL